MSSSSCIKCSSSDIYFCHFCDIINFFCSRCHPDKNLILQVCYNCDLKFCSIHTPICNKSYNPECYNYNPRKYFLCQYCFNDLYKVCDIPKCPVYCSACLPYLTSTDTHNFCLTCQIAIFSL